jgi:hypothetical protein
MFPTKEDNAQREQLAGTDACVSTMMWITSDSSPAELTVAALEQTIVKELETRFEANGCYWQALDSLMLTDDEASTITAAVVWIIA